ncbi:MULTISPECIES: hydrogenase/urease maturation nickel metallochaperone HypA [Bosea]|jgi:hydrogenase nickel incorporation protein HypA/HybF|uniref:Hydrogenase/urease maturation nickel metallochaperone HypA n=1 Tax=Bosea massiliensis TaxID=151419 RepID=A0ABW0P113_9HYPH|nr:hydrogenase/urease maturation nickel metallochaperone HypA [Bosea sp. (in: a-proteobacteria)]MDP3409753.1 hydrogenase/urease maturation nickel metallochaperone HypA [Bosea sp. (in: a-proteobacteria)]
MHELGMARSIAAIVCEHARGRRVRGVRVAIGPHACIERQALAFCWDIVTEGTALAGATLGFVEAEGETFTVKDYEIREDA